MISENMAAVKINDIRCEGDTLIFDPFNPTNVEIEEQDIRTLLSRFGLPNVPINNMALYKRAFIHKSYVKRPTLENIQKGIEIAPKPDDCMALKTKSNDRLEFVGDGVLECITKLYLYERFPKSDEGFMTDTKIALVKNDAIGQLALDIGLSKWYIISKNAEHKNTRTNVKKLGNLFEAFLGALYLDSNKDGQGYAVAQKFIINIFEMPGLVPWHRIIETNENYKNQLQVIIQKEFKTVPHYLESDRIGEEEDKGFKMGVYLCIGQPIHTVVPGHRSELPLSSFQSWQQIHDHVSQNGGKIFVRMGQGQNKIKKRAEQFACKTALDLCLKFN